MNKIKNQTMFAFLIAACLSMQACSTTMLSGDEFRMSGSARGIRAFEDLMTGTAVIAKTEAESLPSNPHHKMRSEQEKSVLEEIRSRFMFSPEQMQGGEK